MWREATRTVVLNLFYLLEFYCSLSSVQVIYLLEVSLVGTLIVSTEYDGNFAMMKEKNNKNLLDKT